VRTFTYASHAAYLDPLHGTGLLVRPLPREDVADPLGGQSLHHADWDAVVRHLDGLGWEPSEDEHGDLCHAGYTSDGREVIGLYGREPIIVPTLDEEARAIAALLAHL
jgi:hypothetical protein